MIVQIAEEVPIDPSPVIAIHYVDFHTGFAISECGQQGIVYEYLDDLGFEVHRCDATAFTVVWDGGEWSYVRMEGLVVATLN